MRKFSFGDGYLYPFVEEYAAQIMQDTATPEPTPTATPVPEPTLEPTVVRAQVAPAVTRPETQPQSVTGPPVFSATRYGVQYEGQPLGCPGYNLPAGRADRLYHSNDPQILAVSYELGKRLECGQGVYITNPRNGATLYAIRMDTCPGCGDNLLDLSEAGIAILCGVQYPATCDRLDGLIVREVW